MIETKKTKETSRSFVALARTQYITDFIKSEENSLILTPKKHTPGHPSPTQPFLRQKNPPEKSLKLMKIWYWSFWPGFWLICWLLPKSLLLSSGGHWKVRFFIGGCVSPLSKNASKKYIYPLWTRVERHAPQKVDEFADEVFLYLAIYIPTPGFARKRMWAKILITDHDFKKKSSKYSFLLFFDSLTCSLGVKSLWQGGNFIFRWKGWVDCCGSPICMYMFLYVCTYTYIRMYSYIKCVNNSISAATCKNLWCQMFVFLPLVFGGSQLWEPCPRFHNIWTRRNSSL